MNIIDFIRMVRNNLVLLIIVPVMLAGLVSYMTRKPDLRFSSETTLYTGIASGSSVDLSKSVNSLISNTAFDNLINVVKSRATQQEVAIRLLAQHLMLEKADRRYILPSSYSELKRITPEAVWQLVVKDSTLVPDFKASVAIPDSLSRADSTISEETFSFAEISDSTRPSWLPQSINETAYWRTVKNLTDFIHSSDTNFVYKLLNFSNPHYSIKAISSVKVQRIGFSDLVRLSYEANDPGICQQTLALFTAACVENYRVLKENRSDAVVKYFEFELKKAAVRLDSAEDKLLKFNLDNDIINYDEQSKAVAGVKEQLGLENNSKKMELAGVQAAIKRLEEKLGTQEQIQLKSSKIIGLRDQLGALSYSMNNLEIRDTLGARQTQKLTELKGQYEQLKEQLASEVADLYKYGNSTEGLPVSSVLNDWLSNVIAAENLKAALAVMADKIKDFQKQYAIYAPAGANLKRIEREISISEQEYLELLHELNQAKLRMQDNELSASIKTIDPPFYPLSPMPNNRKMLVLVGAVVGFVIVLFTVLLLEYFDETLKNQKKAERVLKLLSLGIFPKILFDVRGTDFTFITNRLLELILQKAGLVSGNRVDGKVPQIIVLFSSIGGEGKSVIGGNLALKLKKRGKSVLYMNYSHDSLHEKDTQESIEPSTKEALSQDGSVKKMPQKSLIRWILGYPDIRVNIASPFLEVPENYLESSEYLVYDVNDLLNSMKSIREIPALAGMAIDRLPDYIFIELPPILYFPYPSTLLSEADLPILVCRSNRNWTEADQESLELLKKFTDKQVYFILNGVELQVIETVLGDLPKKRSWLRRILKKVLRLQFSSRSQI